MTMLDVAPTERKIAERIDAGVTSQFEVSTAVGGLGFSNMSQAMEFAKMMSIASVAVPKHLRGNPGACLAVVIQAVEWKLSPYAVANKSYSVNDRLAYESQLIQAVILQRAPIDGRFKVKYTGEGESRVCKVWAKLRDSDETVEYESPPFSKITPKNSPLWKSDPDQQHFYYSGRALCRRHFPDVLLGVYADDEVAHHIGPENARDVTPAKSLSDKLDVLAQASTTDTENGASTTSPAGEVAEQGAPPAAPSPQTAGQPLAADTEAAPETQAPQPNAPSGAAEVWPEGRVPVSETEYQLYTRNGWFAEVGKTITEDQAQARWKSKEEKALRSKCNVGPDVREDLHGNLMDAVTAAKQAA